MLFSVDMWTKLEKTLFVVFLPSNNHDKLYAQVLLYKVLALKLSIF